MDADELFNHAVEFTKAHARRSVAAFRDHAADTDRLQVWVLQMNGAVLGVLGSQVRAEQEAADLRQLYVGEWADGGGSWFHRGLGITITVSAHTVV